MATKLVPTLVDDFDDTEGASTTPFSLDGVDYEIDLGPKRREQLERAMAPFIERARRKGGSTNTRPRRRASGKRSHKTDPGQKEQLDAMRDWARKNGHEVSSRGRFPRALKAEFDAAHAPTHDGAAHGGAVAFSG